MLIPTEPTDLFLFSYPDPLLTILIESITDFFDVHSNWCLPSPKKDNVTVLIPDTESPILLWSLIVVASTIDAKYVASVDNPPTPFWELVLYTTCSPSLNLWYVEKLFV